MSALNVLCAQLTRDLFAIGMFLFSVRESWSCKQTLDTDSLFNIRHFCSCFAFNNAVTIRCRLVSADLHGYFSNDGELLVRCVELFAERCITLSSSRASSVL